MSQCQRTPDAEHLSHTEYPRRFGAGKAVISGLVGDTPDGGEPQVDRRRRVVTLLEVNAIAENHWPVESEARLGTVPRDELADCVVVRPLTTGRREAVSALPSSRVRGRARRGHALAASSCEISFSASVTASLTVADAFTESLSLRRLSGPNAPHRAARHNREGSKEARPAHCPLHVDASWLLRCTMTSQGHQRRSELRAQFFDSPYVFPKEHRCMLQLSS